MPRPTVLLHFDLISKNDIKQLEGKAYVIPEQLHMYPNCILAVAYNSITDRYIAFGECNNNHRTKGIKCKERFKRSMKLPQQSIDRVFKSLIKHLAKKHDISIDHSGIIEERNKKKRITSKRKKISYMKDRYGRTIWRKRYKEKKKELLSAFGVTISEKQIFKSYNLISSNEDEHMIQSELNIQLIQQFVDIYKGGNSQPDVSSNQLFILISKYLEQLQTLNNDSKASEDGEMIVRMNSVREICIEIIQGIDWFNDELRNIEDRAEEFADKANEELLKRRKKKQDTWSVFESAISSSSSTQIEDNDDVKQSVYN
jgi:hypothetical protein